MFIFQLENTYRLFDYGINVNDVIQLMVRIDVAEISPTKKSSRAVKNETPTTSSSSTSSSALDKVNILFY